MKKISNLTYPKRLGAFVSLKTVLNQAINTRNAAFVGLSGYPISSHVVGRIHASLNVDSYKELLFSIKRIRDLCRLAADILNTIPQAKLERQALMRTELVAYIAQNASAYGYKDISVEDQDFVAYLITSTESPESAWMLVRPSATSANRFIKFHSLYQSLVANGPVTFAINDGKAIMTGDSVIYDPKSDEIKGWNDSYRVNLAMREYSKLGLGLDPDQTAKLNERYRQKLDDAALINHLATLRIVDHIFMCMTDMDIWKSFISTAKGQTEPVTRNMERAKSLHLLGSYMHSLLMYPHIFSVEMFRHMYNRLQEWVLHFPPLPAHIVEEYNSIVIKHDVLDASQDALSVLNLLDEPHDPTIDSHITGLPVELTNAFGIDEVLRAATDAASTISTPIVMKDLKELGSPNFNYLLLAHPVSTFDMTYSLSEKILVKDVVTNELRDTAASIVPGIPRFYPDEMLRRLKDLNPRVPFGFSGRVPMSRVLMQTTEASYSGGTFRYRPSTAARTYEYQFDMRRNRVYTIFRGSSVVAEPTVIMNHDMAKRLRDHLGREWKTLIPAQLGMGDQIVTMEGLRADPEQVRRLMENISGMNFELLKLSIGNEYIREIWATYLSAFALMYTIPNGSQSVDVTGAAMVEGRGRPYGVDYTTLARIQPAMSPEKLIKITDTVYLRILEEVPSPTHRLDLDPDFYMNQGYYYYSGNSSRLFGNASKTNPDVVPLQDKWILTDGCWNFSLCPIYACPAPPSVLMDKRYAYLNDYVLMQVDLHYSLSGSADDGFSMALAPTTRSWSFNRTEMFVEHTTFGSYSKHEGSSIAEIAEPEALVRAAEQELKQVEAESSVARMEDAKSNPVPNIDIKPMTVKGASLDLPTPDKKHKKKKSKSGPTDKLPDSGHPHDVVDDGDSEE